jgi:hypothetical protein
VTTVDVKVILRLANGNSVSDEEQGVSLNDDEVSIAAGNLAYGLVEDVWELLVKEDEK